MKSESERRCVTVTRLRKMKLEGEKIACLTAYDATFAAIVDRSGVDVILVGDSLGMVVQGRESTVPVQINEMVYHTQAVVRGRSRALVAADMPFMSYATIDQALRNAARLMQDGGAEMVKLEGGISQVETVRRLSEQGVPVCAHLGLQPQSVHKLGGYRVQGRTQQAAEQMLNDALALQDAGADMMVLECVPAVVAAAVASRLEIPVIGIGAGAGCDGQVLVMHDILGLTLHVTPRFVRNFLQGQPSIEAAFTHYVRAVKDGTFPSAEHAFES